MILKLKQDRNFKKTTQNRLDSFAAKFQNRNSVFTQYKSGPLSSKILGGPDHMFCPISAKYWGGPGPPGPYPTYSTAEIHGYIFGYFECCTSFISPLSSNLEYKVGKWCFHGLNFPPATTYVLRRALCTGKLSPKCVG